MRCSSIRPILSAFFVAILLGAPAEGFELRGPVAEVVDGATYRWSAQDFGGFYYDLDDDVGGESLSLRISGWAIDDLGAVYTSQAQEETIEFPLWGSRMTLGYLGDPHFVGYGRGHLRDESGGEPLLRDELIGKVLIDDDEERTIQEGSPLRLEEGYRLEVVEVDSRGERVSIALLRDGVLVDSAVVEPTEPDASAAYGSYLYKRPLAGEDFVVIAVHFKNGFSSGGDGFATVDGVWQISEETISIREGDEVGEMTVVEIDPEDVTITMANEGRKIALVRGGSRLLLGEIGIRVADQDGFNDSANLTSGRTGDPLRFCIYRSVEEPEPMAIRGHVGEVSDGTAWEWNSSGFGGFNYDIDEGLGDESLVLKFTGDRLEEDGGVVYTSRSQKERMEFEEWGDRWTTSFIGEVRCAGYADGLLRDESDDHNMLAEEQLLKVLIDDDRRDTFDTDSPLGLAEGYKLALDSVDESGRKVSLSLYKDGVPMDSRVIEPSRSGSTLKDQTYLYSRRVGGADGVVVIAVHFRRAFSNGDDGFAEVDGIWQVSDEPDLVEEGEEHGEMAVREVDPSAMTVSMTNRRGIILKPDDDLRLFGDIWIRTADQVVNNSINLATGLPEDPLRFYVRRSAAEET